MRYHVLACDFDGTIAHHEYVDENTLNQLKKIKYSNRKLILVTGRELRDLERVFPAYKVFDHIVAENGALLLDTATGKEELLGAAPDLQFVQSLENNGVLPLSVGKVIIATWEPHQHTVLNLIKEHGLERQVIFNKGAVMILPPGLNKANGLETLLKSLNLSMHNTVAIGDAENDTAMLQAAECGVAVSNALPALKEIVDYVTPSDHGKGVSELIDELLLDDFSKINEKLKRHHLTIGTLKDSDEAFGISPYRSGILLTGVSGGGKSTLTVSIAESLLKSKYQFCLVDPEGDYLELPGAVILGDHKKLPSIDEICELLLSSDQSIVLCLISIPLDERPIFFARLLSALLKERHDIGHPHWIIADEAHHLLPKEAITDEFKELNNFILVSASPDGITKKILSHVGMVITVGDDPAASFEQFADVVNIASPKKMTALETGQCWVWDVENNKSPFIVNINQPAQLQQRHKRKYAHGDMRDTSFIFSGKGGKMKLVANNLMMFVHLAEGIDEDTWLYHAGKHDYSEWFKNDIHDDELAEVALEAEKEKDAAMSKKTIIDYIRSNYTA